MQIKLTAVNQDTGDEGQAQITDTLDLGLVADERIEIESELANTGRCWIGGGAAQLFLAQRI